MKTKQYNLVLEQLKQSKPFKIAFIGDSITSAEWVHPNWRDTFEYILKYSFEEFSGDEWYIPEWNLNFYNYALDGGSSADFLKQTKLAIEEAKPDCVIVMGTFNDQLLGLSVEQQTQSFTKIFNLLSETTQFFVYSPDIYSLDNEINEVYKAYREAVLALPRYENQIVINGYEQFQKYPTEKFYTLVLPDFEKQPGKPDNDLVHPNALGNSYIAKMFLEGVFGIQVNPERYIEDVMSGIVKYPRW